MGDGRCALGGGLGVFPELLWANQRAPRSMGDLVSKSNVDTVEEDTHVDLWLLYEHTGAHAHTYVQDMKTI